ncbi:hypothetical protein [Tamlana crocina]|uniref:Lipoprotein n=1 Tax=Tamlana crocina TaxID=393006 RepID=A0ABX1DE61_9FLAO|nr:hypothetical protein [Tamlana crocina]NJX16637.1 hypothetical protein [Tamlana crocina]
MKKIIYLAFIALSIVFNSCSDNQEFKDIYYNGVEPNFSESDIELGNLFAESLSKTTKKLKNNNIDLKNRWAVQKVANEVTTEVIGNKYAIPQEDMLILQEENIALKQMNKNPTTKQTLTTMQQRALNAIEHARTHSKSALAFMDKLAAINQRVDDLVPEGERELLHQIIAFDYYGLKVMNKLVRTGYMPGKAEYRPKKIKTGTTMAFNNTSLLDLTKIAHANGEVEVLAEIVIVVPAYSEGDGISWSDWYQLQDAYGNYYADEGTNDDYDDDYQNTNYSEEEESWWNEWGDNWYDCMLRSVGVDAVIELFNGKVTKQVAKKALRKILSRTLGWVGAGIAVYEFGSCMEWY